MQILFKNMALNRLMLKSRIYIVIIHLHFVENEQHTCIHIVSAFVAQQKNHSVENDFIGACSLYMQANHTSTFSLPLLHEHSHENRFTRAQLEIKNLSLYFSHSHSHTHLVLVVFSYIWHSRVQKKCLFILEAQQTHARMLFAWCKIFGPKVICLAQTFEQLRAQLHLIMSPKCVYKYIQALKWCRFDPHY